MPVGCLRPVAPFNGKYFPLMQIWNTADVVMYSCDANFTLIGETNATCLASGQYDNPIPECVGMDILNIICCLSLLVFKPSANNEKNYFGVEFVSKSRRTIYTSSLKLCIKTRKLL